MGGSEESSLREESLLDKLEGPKYAARRALPGPRYARLAACGEGKALKPLRLTIATISQARIRIRYTGCAPNLLKLERRLVTRRRSSGTKSRLVRCDISVALLITLVQVGTLSFSHPRLAGPFYLFIYWPYLP